MKNEFLEAQRLLDIGLRIDKMRSLYKTSSHYDRFFIEKDAKRLQKNLNISVGRFKAFLKRKYYYSDLIINMIDGVY